MNVPSTPPHPTPRKTLELSLESFRSEVSLLKENVERYERYLKDTRERLVYAKSAAEATEAALEQLID